MITVNVLFLGPTRDFANVEDASLELSDGATVADLRGVLAERFDRLAPALESIRIAVNEAFAEEHTVLETGDEVALIPPVSGGSDGEGIWVDVVTEPIAVQRVYELVTGDPQWGGIVTFTGTTRKEHDPDHGALLRLDYTGYEGMARRELMRLAVEAKERWSAGRIALVHRLGPVPPGEVSVVVAVACGHRAGSFQACRWLIDTLKKDVPIWKKDVFEDGHVRWVQPPAAETHQKDNSSRGL